MTALLSVAASLVGGLALLFLATGFAPSGEAITLEDVGVLAGFILMGMGIGRTAFGVFAAGVTAALLGLIGQEH